MKTASAKAKSRRLQQRVRDAVLRAFPELTEADVVSTPMGVGGIDVQLSQRARQLFPYAVEGKNVERVNVWAAIAQAREHAKSTNLEPLVVICRNRTEPHVVLSLDHFVDLVATTRRQRRRVRLKG